MYIDVLLQINAFDDMTFTYNVPLNMQKDIELGKRVLIPFGKKELKGIILNIKYTNESDYEIKDIIEIIDDEPILNKELLELGLYMKETYLCPLITCYQSMIPSALKFNNTITNIKYDTYIIKNKEYQTDKKSEINILNLFNNNEKIKKSDITNKISLKKLLELEVLKEIKEEKYRINDNNELNKLNVLTPNQLETYNYINNSSKDIILLRGVTGSGKTEIYMHLIKDVISSNKTAIVLVPEISLTTQLINRFKDIFGNKVAIIHSSLSDGERYDEWRKIKRSEVDLVIGTRSAIFAPISNLGLIIIDEEQEDSYKQENNPKYRTIDIAIKRMEYNEAKL